MALLQKSALRRLTVRPGVPLLGRASSSPSTRRHFSLGENFTALSTYTAESIAQVHQAGMPWYVTIPLIAAGVNFGCRLPLQWYHRILQVRRRKVAPFVDAWASRHSQEVLRDPAFAGEQLSTHEQLSRLRKSRGRIYKTFHCQYWKSLVPFLGSIPFITVSDALRRLSGVTPPHTLIDPSITEGGLWWFTDLTLRDPYLLLPAACSIALGASIYRGLDPKTILGSVANTNRPARLEHRVFDTMRRVALLLPAFPLLMFYNPAAMFLYWLTTFSLTHVNYFILDQFLPFPQRTLQAPAKDQVKLVKPWIHSSNGRTPEAESTTSKPEGA